MADIYIYIYSYIGIITQLITGGAPPCDICRSDLGPFLVPKLEVATVDKAYVQYVQCRSMQVEMICHQNMTFYATVPPV